MSNATTPPTFDKMYRIEEVVERTSVSRTKLYEQVAAGKLKTLKLGRATLIRESDLAAWQAGLQSK